MIRHQSRSPNGQFIVWRLYYHKNTFQEGFDKAAGRFGISGYSRNAALAAATVRQSVWVQDVLNDTTREVWESQESIFAISLYTQDYDERVPGSHDDIAWSPDSKHFACVTIGSSGTVLHVWSK